MVMRFLLAHTMAIERIFTIEERRVIGAEDIVRRSLASIIAPFFRTCIGF